VSLRELFALGVTGGIVPCPAALVVLLSAVALRRVGFGLFLIVAFSAGLAAVLIAIGILMVYAGKLMARYRTDSPLITRWLPLTSSAVIGILGMAIAFQALMTAGIVRVSLG
jgi:ABC-type nickel/cobalt efflux system permease component RcnA